MLNKKKYILYSILILNLGILNSCTPKIYVIDRQTYLHESAAGEWPEFETSLTKNLKNKSSTLLPQETILKETKKKKTYQVLNGSMGLKK